MTDFIILHNIIDSFLYQTKVTRPQPSIFLIQAQGGKCKFVTCWNNKYLADYFQLP